jgi:ATP-dependent Clp protease ATP-binding subunit ClpX
MYELPSLKNVKECVITEEVINGTGLPVLIYESEKGVKSA